MANVKISKKIWWGIKSLWYFIWGNLFAVFIYDRKYLKGRHFESKYWGIGAKGWEWVYRNFPYQAFLGINSGVPWPVVPQSRIGNYKNIEFHPDNLDNFQSFGVYFQAIGAKIIIGEGATFAPNVGVITANHDLYDPDIQAEGREVRIGKKCWIGMNAMIMPGVVLGDHTIVGAGSVVTKSFPDGYCIIAGNPAKVIKTL